MGIKRFAVTVAIDDLTVTLTMEEFTDGGLAVLANLPEQAANIARQGGMILKEQIDAAD